MKVSVYVTGYISNNRKYIMLTVENYSLITSVDQYQSIETELSQAATLAISLEYDALHSYDDRLSMLALSTGKSAYLIDLHEVETKYLTPIMANRQIIKIFYDGHDNIQLMQTELGWTFRSVVDLYYIYELIRPENTENSLNNLIDDLLDHDSINLSLDQPKWSNRPLTKEVLDVVFNRVRYLQRLLVIMQKQLEPEQKKLLEVFFLQIPLIRNRTDTPLMKAFQICHDKKVTNPVDRLLIYRLVVFREEIGKKKDVAGESVINQEQLKRIISRKPRNASELQNYGLFEEYLKDYHQQILDLIKQTISKSPKEIDSDSRYLELDEKFRHYYPYQNHLDENYEWPYEISISSYRNRRGIIRIIYDMIEWKVGADKMQFLFTENLQHQLTVNESIRLDLLRPKIDQCETIDDFATFITETVELVYSLDN